MKGRIHTIVRREKGCKSGELCIQRISARNYILNYTYDYANKRKRHILNNKDSKMKVLLNM